MRGKRPGRPTRRRIATGPGRDPRIPLQVRGAANAAFHRGASHDRSGYLTPDGLFLPTGDGLFCGYDDPAVTWVHAMNLDSGEAIHTGTYQWSHEPAVHVAGIAPDATWFAIAIEGSLYLHELQTSSGKLGPDP